MPIEVVSQQASTVDDILKREVAILKPNAGRCGNLIKTSRFNLLSFVPITLYELLHPWKRFANFYFLCVGAMQMVPVITLTDGNPSTWMTLSFLVLVDMVVMAAEDMSRHKQTAEEVGRFYYRRPTGESGADVYDRAASFWDSLLGGSFNMQDLFRRRRAGPDDALLVVTHGLTMRLLMMRYFNWSPQTFDAVYNPGNCDFWVLVKDEARRAYRLEPGDCSPPCTPWATRRTIDWRRRWVLRHVELEIGNEIETDA